MLKGILNIGFILIFQCQVTAQIHGAVLGRSITLPFSGKDVELTFIDSLIVDLGKRYTFLILFSSTKSRLTSDEIQQLYQFVDAGGNLYIGADNYPFTSESDQLTMTWFGKRFWGNQIETNAESNLKICSNNLFEQKSTLPAGQTTASFPLDYRLKVELWVNDEPLILSGQIGQGKIILDGGYSRFNTALFDSEIAAKMFQELIVFLSSH